MPFTPEEFKHMQELRDRIITVERDQVNMEKSFTAFKTDTDLEFKSLHTKIDLLTDKIDKINTTLAKWMGGMGVALVALEVVMKMALK